MGDSIVYVYQLSAEGVSCDMRQECRSSTVFVSRELAEKFVERMADKLSDPARPLPWDRERTKIEILELKVIESMTDTGKSKPNEAPDESFRCGCGSPSRTIRAGYS